MCRETPINQGTILNPPLLELYYKDDGFEVMNVDYPIKNLSEFANKNGINYKTLKIFNPWLIQNHLNNRSKKKYKIKIPK